MTKAEMCLRKNEKWWITLGFATKKDLEKRIRNVVASYNDGDNLSMNDQQWVTIILEHHADFAQKSGCGIQHIQTRTNTSWFGTTRGFWIIRTDGSEVDISWVIALKPKGSITSKENVYRAARFEISDQIHEFHDKGACSVCEICNLHMTRNYYVHVDHVYPFCKLFDEFLGSKGLVYNDICVGKNENDENVFEDKCFAQEWKSHHQQKAKLRIVHKKCNLSRRRLND